MSPGLRTQRTRQGAAPPRLNPRFARASSGLWLPTSNKNAVTGQPLAAMTGGRPSILAGSQGRAWTTSGQSLSLGATTAGWDTGYNRLPAALTLVCVFISYDTPSSGGGYGSPFSKDQYAFNFHHTNAGYQAGVSLHIGGGAGTYPNIQFGETAAGVLRRWVATWDGNVLKAWSSGRYIGSVAAAGALNTTDTGNLALCCAAGGISAWNGQIFLAGLLPHALNDTQAKRVSENPWLLQAPAERRVWMWVDTPSSGVTGTLATTNASDTLSAAGTPTVAGSLARTNANDTLAAAGTTTVTGSLAKTNANDSVAAAGSPVVAGSLAKTNADDSLAASGDVGGAVTGTLNRQNANDSLAAAGTTTVTGALATTNAPDTLVAVGSPTVVGSLAKTEGADTLQASGAAGSVTGTVAVANRNDALDARGTAGNPQEASGGYFGAMPKSRKRVHEDRIRFGVLPRPVVKAAKRVAAKVVEQADEESPLELFREQRPRFETELKQELAALPEPPQWVDSFGLQIEIQIEAALQRRRRQRDDDDLLLMLL